ncbi:MAG: class I SAM-dependent methyltransferase [Leptolyngbyaceae cyanobacterium SM1_3_5]|nr:class I SAM-dependent methyltransferase [Leptolyngbyaceae cyanobacterium SM1_3_5]
MTSSSLNLNVFNASEPLQSQAELNGQRLHCSICNYRIDPNDESLFATFPCNVRAFQDQSFKVWRCPTCRTIHCLDVVNLDEYYAKYPIASAVAHDSARACYKNIHRRLTRHGFSKHHSLLDYGCGGNGLFVQYLRSQGFSQSYGYDPYSSDPHFGDRTILDKQPFDYILLQDVIEHVEDPTVLLQELDRLLAPGGYILIGAPNADAIDLNRPDLAEYYNEVHVPYHLHMYTREVTEALGKNQGWMPVGFFDRPFHDLLFGMNSRAWNEYVRLMGGTLDVIYEPSNTRKAISSPRFLFHLLFGYWFSFRTSMAVMFQKSAG